MPFVKREWVDRIPAAGKSGRRKFKNVETGVETLYDVSMADDATTAGDEWNAENMNDLENRIATYLNTYLNVQSGTFTPSIKDTEYYVETKEGTYLKIGNLCYITIHFKSTSDVGASSNNITITGLPFAPFADEEQQLVVGHTAKFTPPGTKMAVIPKRQNSINMWVDTGTGGMTRMTHTIAGKFEIRICGVYRTV